MVLEQSVVCRGQPALGITTSYRDIWHLTASHLLSIPTHHGPDDEPVGQNVWDDADGRYAE